MRLLLACLLLLYSLTAAGQELDPEGKATYNAILNRARANYHAKNYLQSALAYDSALSIDDSDANEWYDAACSWALAANEEKAVGALRNSFEKGYKNFDWMYYDRDLTSVRNNPGYIAVEKKYRPPNTIFFFDIIRALNENSDAWFDGKTVSLVLGDYTLADVEARSGITLRRAPGDTLIDFSTKSLEFRNCNFENPDGTSNEIALMALGQLAFHGCRGSMGLSKVSVGHLLFLRTRFGVSEKMDITFNDVRQNGLFSMHASGTFLRWDNTVMQIRIPDKDIVFSDGTANEIDDREGMHFHADHTSIVLRSVVIDRDEQEDNVIPFDLILDTESLQMENVRLGYTSRLQGSVKETLTIEDCRFPPEFDLLAMRFPSSNVSIPFQQFRNTRFVILDINDNGYSLEGDSVHDIVHEKFSDQLTRLHKALYDNYRSRGDLTSANACYVRLKELEIEHLKAKEGKDLEERMRLWLNRFMGFYTNHATSPGRGILVSFWIVLSFAVFYFFFPSDWDKESKSQLRHDFRVFIEKNEHGYVRPFFKMMGGFLLSFLNALTLSMNAFITLGFGNIPTTGLPRYVCVVQGVLGWFLLSLFTVALLNQVLL